LASKKNRFQTWLAVILVGAGLLPAALLGLWWLAGATAKILHPNPQDVPSVTRSDPSPMWAEAVDQGRQIVRASLAEQNLPGLSVAVGASDDIVWAEGFGFADLETHLPVSPETRFRIGTASTVLTSAAVGLLLEKERLKLDERIQTYVPDFPEKQWPVTLRQLMGQLSGVRNDGGDEGPLLAVRCERPIESLQHFKDGPLLFEPGTQYRASSYGWILVSAAVEAAADESFLSFARTQIFRPLGMDHTAADSSTESIEDRATFYFPRFAADPHFGLHPMRPLDYSCYSGSSVFLSTPSDLVRFSLAINSGKLLKPTTVELLQTPQRLATGQETNYGLGWNLDSVSLAGEQARMVGHNGETLGGMVASLQMFPDRGLVVAVMSNISYADTASVASSIARAFSNRETGPALR
jgi:serine beta-lactamase-like protein LACTB, mitochondrial